MSFKVIAKYIKKIEFNIPSTKTFFLLSEEIKNYKIKIDIKSNQFRDKLLEIELTLKLESNKLNNNNILSKVVYSTIIELEDNIDKEKLEEIILVKVPTESYPGLRKIFINIFESSGFKDIKIESKIDFKKLYEQRKNQ